MPNPLSAPARKAPAPATPGKAPAPAPLRFSIASRTSSRFSFSLPTTALGSGSVPLTPVQLPATGYLSRVTLDVTVATTGGTSPALLADGPFNVLGSVGLRNSSGNDIIVPLDGYSLFLANKYGAQMVDAPNCDPRSDPTFDAVLPSVHFMIDVPCEISPADAFCAVPALASNRNYQLQVTLNALANVFSGSPTATVTINGTAWYHTQPQAQTLNGLAQQTAPPYNGSVNMWQFEPLSVTPGDKYLDLSNTGNIIRALVFVLRNSSGAREDSDWPAVCELYLDNNAMFYLPVNTWLSWMGELYGYNGATKDTRGALDTGVYVVPFLALAEGAARANGRRSQYLPTMGSSQLQLRGTSWGSGVSTVQVLTNCVSPKDPATNQPLTAVYAIS